MSSDKEILALEDKRYAAMCGGDFAALEAMLHDELLYTHSSGLTDTKATWLASLRSGKTKYKSATCSDRKVRLAGDTALVTGRAAIEAEINGQPRSLRLVFLNAWTQTPKGWKFIAWHCDIYQYWAIILVIAARRLRGKNPQRRETRRSTGDAVDDLRVRHQHQRLREHLTSRLCPDYSPSPTRQSTKHIELMPEEEREKLRKSIR